MDQTLLAHAIRLLELAGDLLAQYAMEADDDDAFDAAQRLADLVSDLKACLG